MNISIKCNISLSKKFRALNGNKNNKLTLITGTLVNGVGEGTINLSVDENTNIDDLFNKETNIMIVPLEVVDQSVYLQENYNEDTDNNSRVANLFMDGADIENNADNPIIKKFGAVRPPENRKQNSISIKEKHQIEKETPTSFKATQNPDAKRYITNINQLVEAIHLAENKKSDVDINKIQNPRLRAVAMEEKEKAEAIDFPAFVVNHSCAIITINDLGISLSLNIPYNLNNISSKRLANSKELQSMIRSNLIKFIKPDEVQDYMKKITEPDNMGLEVYDNYRQAEAAIGEIGQSKSHMQNHTQMVKISEGNDLSLKELDGDTEEEKILKSLPPRRIVTEENDNGETVVTSHRTNEGTRARNQRDITSDSVENNKGIKSIRRSGIQFN